MSNFLSENGKQSSMRAAFLVITGAVALVLFSVTVVILSSLWSKEPVDYMGLAAVVGALSAPLTGVAISKANQKRYEHTEPETYG